MGLPSFAGVKRWFACAPASVVCPQPRPLACVGSTPALCPATALPMKPPSVQSPFARFSVVSTSGSCISPPRRALPLRHRYYGLMRQSLPVLLSFGLSLVRGVFAGCYQPRLPTGPSRRYLCESFLGCLVPCHGGPTGCACLFLPRCHRPSPTEVWVGFPLYPRTRFFRGAFFDAADISLCSDLRVCSSPRSLLPLRIPPQGSRDFYVRASRASLPPHAPDMLTVRIQAIDGARTFTPQDSQPCRLLPPVHASTARALRAGSAKLGAEWFATPFS